MNDLRDDKIATAIKGHWSDQDHHWLINQIDQWWYHWSYRITLTINDGYEKFFSYLEDIKGDEFFSLTFDFSSNGKCSFKKTFINKGSGLCFTFYYFDKLIYDIICSYVNFHLLIYRARRRPSCSFYQRIFKSIMKKLDAKYFSKDLWYEVDASRAFDDGEWYL